jgi:hypothetical protein
MDFNALQHKLFELDPSDPAEDLRKLTESAGGQAQGNVAETVNYVQESVEVKEGTMPVEGDYSLGDFAALAGIKLTEAPATGMIAQLKKGYDNAGNAMAYTGKDSAMAKPQGAAQGSAAAADSKVKGTVNPQKLAADLGVSDPKMLVMAIQKTKTGKQLTRTEQVSMAEAFQRLMQLDPSQTQKIMMQLKRMEMEPTESIKKTPIKNRNPVASHAQSSGSGVHKDQFKKNLPDRKQKHKKDYANESIKEMLYRKLNENR